MLENDFFTVEQGLLKEVLSDVFFADKQVERENLKFSDELEAQKAVIQEALVRLGADE